MLHSFGESGVLFVLLNMQMEPPGGVHNLCLCVTVPLAVRRRWKIYFFEFSDGELYGVYFSPADVPFPSLGSDTCYLVWLAVNFELYSQN